MTTDRPKVTPYLAAGCPQNCFLPSCQKPFERECFRGKDGRFYCSPACAEVGQTIGLSNVESLKRSKS
jgi:hypothetical protein